MRLAPHTETVSPRLTSALVVEDDHMNRQCLVRLLAQVGVIADSAPTVAMALQKLDLWPELVLLDMELPDGSGADVLRQIREQRMPARVCVLTGSCQPHEIESLATLQPDAVLIKPYPIDDLLNWLRSAREA